MTRFGQACILLAITAVLMVGSVVVPAVVDRANGQDATALSSDGSSQQVVSPVPASIAFANGEN